MNEINTQRHVIILVVSSCVISTTVLHVKGFFMGSFPANYACEPPTDSNPMSLLAHMWPKQSENNIQMSANTNEKL